MSQLLSKSIGERRTSPRQRRMNGAKIIFNDNSSVINCVVGSTSPPKGRDYASPALWAFQIVLICELTEMARVLHRK